jgi:hypothetical protein
MELVANMSDAAKARVAELGFGQLLELRMEGIPDRAFGMFLTSRVRDNPPRLQIGRKVLPINAEAVKKVLGLPCNPEGRSFPNWTYQEKLQGRADFRRLCDERGMKATYEKNEKLEVYNKLKHPEVPRWFLGELAKSHSVPVDWAVQAFFVCLSNAFLFPTTSDRIVAHDYLRAKDLDAIQSINWCQEVVKDLMNASSDWNKAISAGSKSTPAIKGCMAFLMVCYFQQFSCFMKPNLSNYNYHNYFSQQLLSAILCFCNAYIQQLSVTSLLPQQFFVIERLHSAIMSNIIAFSAIFLFYNVSIQQLALTSLLYSAIVLSNFLFHMTFIQQLVVTLYFPQQLLAIPVQQLLAVTVQQLFAIPIQQLLPIPVQQLLANTSSAIIIKYQFSNYCTPIIHSN